MDKEQWGTLSIYDHRTPLLLESLVFFDRLIIPVPTEPIYDISINELERLALDVEYLEKHDAAVAFKWDSDSFQEWQRQLVREALSVGGRDNLYDSRLMLQKTAPNDVIATPVYGAREGYDSAAEEIENTPNEMLTLELAQKLSVPSADVPFSEIIKLRASPSFQSSMTALRKWRMSVLPDLIDSPKSGARAAGRDLARLIARYEEELESSNIKKRQACIVSVLALGAAASGATVGMAGMFAALAAAAPALFAIKDSVKPFWKEIRDHEFAAAGVIYESEKIFNQYREGH